LVGSTNFGFSDLAPIRSPAVRGGGAKQDKRARGVRLRRRPPMMDAVLFVVIAGTVLLGR